MVRNLPFALSLLIGVAFCLFCGTTGDKSPATLGVELPAKFQNGNFMLPAKENVALDVPRDLSAKQLSDSTDSTEEPVEDEDDEDEDLSDEDEDLSDEDEDLSDEDADLQESEERKYLRVSPRRLNGYLSALGALAGQTAHALVGHTANAFGAGGYSHVGDGRGGGGYPLLGGGGAFLGDGGGYPFHRPGHGGGALLGDGGGYPLHRPGHGGGDWPR